MSEQTVHPAVAFPPITDQLPAAAEQPQAGGGEVTPPPTRRRRMSIVFAVLSVLVAAFLLFAVWYLVNRKPVTQILPGITTEQLPHYATSFYGVTAPTGVAVAADGSRVYATQTERDPKVVIFDASGKAIGTLAPPASTGSSHVPVYVAVNPTNGNVYVSDRPAGALYVYAADGTFLRTFDPGPNLKGWTPMGLAFDSKGDLFVTGLGAPYMAVHEFAPDGSFVRTFGASGQMNFPNGVAVDREGNVYVSDSNNGRMLVFSPDGQQIGSVKRGSAASELGLPRGIAVDDQDRVYVADVSTQGVLLYHAQAGGSEAPKYIGTIGVQGTVDGAFQFPNAVAVDGRGHLYVADWRNNRIQMWSY
ncbi:MAG TPA: SBBP repeat-containing protein [Candidatus Limnocylindrales bacterium]